MSNIKELGPCRQLGALVLQELSLQPNTSGTSVFWEQWVCAPEVGREKDRGYFSNDWRSSCPEINDLLYFKWQTYFFASTLALGSPLLTLFSSNIGSLIKGASGNTECWFYLDSRKQKTMHAPHEYNLLLLFDQKHVFCWRTALGGCGLGTGCGLIYWFERGSTLNLHIKFSLLATETVIQPMKTVV